ncbi:MAG: hypothetical protein ACRBBW_20345 [Cellvibrionaceae bacterium]
MDGLSPVVLTVLVSIANGAIALLIAVICSLYVRLERLKETHYNFQIEVAENYATKNDFTNGLERIENKLDKLFDDIHRG